MVAHPIFLSMVSIYFSMCNLIGCLAKIANLFFGGFGKTCKKGFICKNYFDDDCF